MEILPNMSFFKKAFSFLAMTGLVFGSTSADSQAIPSTGYNISTPSYKKGGGNAKIRKPVAKVKLDKKRASLRRMDGKSRNINHKNAK